MYNIQMSKNTFISILVLILILFLIIIKNNQDTSKPIGLKDTSMILAFGDSLTHGFGVSDEFSYPKQMQKKTGLKIINAGVNGELSSEGLIRLPSLLINKPDLVILCHGGNDILQKLSSSVLKNNLLQMVQLIQKSGAEVLLVGVPDFSLFSFDTHEIYEEVADETGVLLEDDILRHIELNRSLKSDYIHPNEKGYEMMADTFIEILEI